MLFKEASCDHPDKLARAAWGRAKPCQSTKPDSSGKSLLALPGDVVGAGQWIGTDDSLSLRALTPVGFPAARIKGASLRRVPLDSVVCRRAGLQCWSRHFAFHLSLRVNGDFA